MQLTTHFLFFSQYIPLIERVEFLAVPNDTAGSAGCETPMLVPMDYAFEILTVPLTGC